MSGRPHCIIAYTAEDDRYAALRMTAEVTARDAAAQLILYDIDAAGMFAAPLPTAEWSAEGARDLFPDLMAPDDLERAGRHQIADQVRHARRAGVEAYGWLPSKKGAGGLADYAGAHNVDLILLPADMEAPGLVDRLRHATVKDAVETTGLQIAVVDDNGRVEMRSLPDSEDASHEQL